MNSNTAPPNTQREEDATGVRHVDHSETMRDRNKRAFETWDLGDGLPLPRPPFGSGCRVYSCWTPCAAGHNCCAWHGGADAVPPAGRSAMPWRLSPADVAIFLGYAHDAALALAGARRVALWMRLVFLIEDATWRSPWSVAHEAARRCRAYERERGGHGRALAAWYRALALVLLAGARWRA